MAILKTPEHRFEDLPDFSYQPNYVEVGEPRMAYIDEGEGRGTFLCLHGEPTWSFLYRKMIPILAEEGRVVVPDFIGFGRSDKYEDMEVYSFRLYYDWLVKFIEELNLDNITLICQDWGGMLGLTAAVNHPDRFSRLVPMNTGLNDGTGEMSDEWWEFRDFVEEVEDLPIGSLIQDGLNKEISDEVIEAYEAPFPDASYKAAAKAWPLLVPTNPEMGGAEMMGEAIDKISEWKKPAFVLFSDSDPITSHVRNALRGLIPTASEQPDVWIKGAGHFLQEEKGEEIAGHILDFVDRTPMD